MIQKSKLAKPFARQLAKTVYKAASIGPASQERVMHSLVHKARKTVFGLDHSFHSIRTYDDFRKNIPIRKYEALLPYINQIFEGERSVLWPGKPLYFSKTSGTTAGSKFIPITPASVKPMMNGARNMLACYIYHSGNSAFADGEMIFLSGSPELENYKGYLTGRLSGIVNHHIPPYLRRNQIPAYKTNCIEDWEEKVAQIVDESLEANMSLISGIPPWAMMYFETLLERTGKKTIKEIFPNLAIFAHGGVDYTPYRSKIDSILGENVQLLETYPASEGFIAFQDLPEDEGLLLNVNAGMFFEFVPPETLESENPVRLSLSEVELDKNYALVLSTNAGLWAYLIGDTVKFVSKDPYRIRATGRIKHFISAFGEHVIEHEINESLSYGLQMAGGKVLECHVAPVVNDEYGKSYHQWFVAFDEAAEDLEELEKQIDNKLRSMNSYYDDLRGGNMLENLTITRLPSNSFRQYMKTKGKLGGQNKVPRLMNNRKLADELTLMFCT